MTEEAMTPNLAVRVTLEAISEIMGKNGCKIVYRNAGLSHLYDSPPEFDWSPCVPVSYQERLFREVAELLGIKGALSIWRKIGYANIKYAAEQSLILDAFVDMQPNEKFSKSLELMALSMNVGRLVVHPDGSIDFDAFDCNICSGLEYERSICFPITGAMQFIADWSFGKNVYIAKETKCKAKGDDTCYFVFEKGE